MLRADTAHRALALTLTLTLCVATTSKCNRPLNNPHGQIDANSHLLHSALTGDPRTLDPSRVGDTVSSAIASNLHDTPYQFHYWHRPLQLVPAMATALPEYGRRSIDGRQYQTLRFSIQPGLRYANDPCFGDSGREILIDDILFAIKRAADTTLDPFGLPLLQGNIVGFDDYSDRLSHARNHAERDIIYDEALPGAIRVDDYTLELVLERPAPMLIYFFAMTTGSPVPRRCVDYYDGNSGRPSYDRQPATSGPFRLAEWWPNRRITLERNPDYREEYFPPSPTLQSPPHDDNMVRRLPLADRVQFHIVRAGPTRWTLFEQGYLDRAGIPSEVFDQVIVDGQLSEHYRSLGVRLDRSVEMVTIWWYFHLDDPIVGGDNWQLRKALSLAIDREELIGRFFNGRGVAAHSPLPPGMEGYHDDYRNPASGFDRQRARDLLIEAGYPGGIDPRTGRPLRLHLTLVANPGAASTYRFYADQLAEINIELVIEQLDWPTVLEKKHKKNFQMIHGGWKADYPDPQNFLQLFYGPNSAGTYNENNYRNPHFDALYREVAAMPPGPQRQARIATMLELLAKDVPVVWLFHPVSYTLNHGHVEPVEPSPIDYNRLKFIAIDPEQRYRYVNDRNRLFGRRLPGSLSQ